MKMRLVVSKAERTMVVAALMAYGSQSRLVNRFLEATSDTADDGPEVDILRPLRPVLVPELPQQHQMIA